MSDIDADGRPRGRPTVAVVLALVFLTVLGAAVGVILGTQRGGDGGNNVANGSTAPTTSGPTGTETASPNGTDGARTKPPATTKSYPPTVKSDCPKQTEDAAGADLTVKLFIRTSKSEVWICQGGGRTYYQGHLRGRPFPSATSDTSLFLQNPQYEAGVWRATNGATVYFVSPERLRIERGGKEDSNEPADEVYEG